MTSPVCAQPLPQAWPGGAGVLGKMAPVVAAFPCDLADLAGRIIAAVAPSDPALVLLFGNPAAGLGVLGGQISRALGDNHQRGHHQGGCHVVGCSSAGEIGPRGYCRDSVVAVALPSAGFRAGVCVLRDQVQIPVSDWMAGLRRFHADFLADPRRSCFGMLLADALALHEDVLVATLDAAMPGLPVIGGSTAEGTCFAPTCLTVDGITQNGAAVFLLIETALSVAEVSFAHFLPSERRAVVTAADSQSRIIWELNAEPAAQEYARLTGIAENALTQAEFAHHPLLLRAGRRHHVRAIRAVVPGGGLQLMSGIEAGNILTIGRAIDMTRGFTDAMDALPRPPVMVLGFDCILRRLALERAGMSGQMSDLLARYRVAGFNTFGEQHRGMHVNQTFVGMALMAPENG